MAEFDTYGGQAHSNKISISVFCRSVDEVISHAFEGFNEFPLTDKESIVVISVVRFSILTIVY